MILGIIEHDGSKINDATFEALTLARKLAEESGSRLEALLMGTEVASLSDSLKDVGVSIAHLVEDSRFGNYAPEALAKCVAQFIEAKGPIAVTSAGTDRGNELMAHLGAQLDQPMAANCIEVSANGDSYSVVRQRWGGSLLEDASLSGNPKLFTVAPHTVSSENATGTGISIEPFAPNLSDSDFRVQVSEVIQSEREGVSLSDAKIVIGGGRGVGSEESFVALEELAQLLNGAVGGSRVATNNGWRPHSDQIGQTGLQIAPDLYIACGISGAIQHIVGCKGSKNILAINTDADAPIFARADYGVIGDLHEVVPALIEEIKKMKGV
jgi:electron transfer flavoprotein alpha subunit